MWQSKILSIAGASRTGLSRWVIIICQWMIIVSALVIVFAIFSDIISRFVFGPSIWGTEEVTLSAVLYLWFAGWVYATFTRTHIGANFPIRKRLAKDIYSIVSPALCLIITLIFCYLAYEYCAFLVAQEARSITFRVPLIYTVAVAFIGLVLTAGYLLWEIVGNVRDLRQAREKTR